jgi:hypothetical protein
MSLTSESVTAPQTPEILLLCPENYTIHLTFLILLIIGPLEDPPHPSTGVDI